MSNKFGLFSQSSRQQQQQLLLSLFEPIKSNHCSFSVLECQGMNEHTNQKSKLHSAHTPNSAGTSSNQSKSSFVDTAKKIYFSNVPLSTRTVH